MRNGERMGSTAIVGAARPRVLFKGNKDGVAIARSAELCGGLMGRNVLVEPPASAESLFAVVPGTIQNGKRLPTAGGADFYQSDSTVLLSIS